MSIQIQQTDWPNTTLMECFFEQKYKKKVGKKLPLGQFFRFSISFLNGAKHHSQSGGVVKLLLEREDVNPDSLDEVGRTPLSYAAGNGHEGVVELLLVREDVNPLYKTGPKTLLYAASKEHRECRRVNTSLEYPRAYPV